MSENLFDDIGYDLLEKIDPPSLPVKNLETSSPAPDSGNKGGWSTLWIILGIAGAGFVGYKIWKHIKERNDEKRK